MQPQFGLSFLSSDSSDSSSPDDFLGALGDGGQGVNNNNYEIGAFGGVGVAAVNALGGGDMNSNSNTITCNIGGRKKRRSRRPRTITGARKWLLGERIGSGASASVRAGIDVESLQLAAVKVVDMRKVRRTRGGEERVKSEVKVMRALRHPNVVALRDVVVDPARQRQYLILELVNGCSLQDLIQKEGYGRAGEGGRVLPDTQVANLAYQTLIALEYVHGRGYVHRDVKPANLLLAANTGVLKLSDFGVAELLDVYDAEDRVSKTLGSPAFQAPEIASGADEYSGSKVDVWALGVTLFYLLTGNVPFQAESHIGLFRTIAAGSYSYPDEHINNNNITAPPTTTSNIVVSQGAKDCIAKMLVVDFKQRASVDHLLKDPWILMGAEPRNNNQQSQLGWTVVKARDFHLLELVNRYLEGDTPTASRDNNNDNSDDNNNIGGDDDNRIRNSNSSGAERSRTTLSGLFGGMFGSGS